MEEFKDENTQENQEYKNLGVNDGQTNPRETDENLNDEDENLSDEDIADADAENEAIIEEDKKLKESVANNEFRGISAQDKSILSTPMVEHPLSGKPVYATAAQAELAESLKDKQ